MTAGTAAATAVVSATAVAVLAFPAAAVAAAVLPAAAPVVAAPVVAAPVVAACVGVAVVVDFGQLGAGVRSSCAAGDPGSGLQALTGAGFGYGFAPSGLVCQIDGRPDPCPPVPPLNAYWSYWHAQPGGSWRYSSVGAGSYNPAPGTVEGWAFGAGAAPGIAPPAAAAPPVPPPPGPPPAPPPSQQPSQPPAQGPSQASPQPAPGRPGNAAGPGGSSAPAAGGSPGAGTIAEMTTSPAGAASPATTDNGVSTAAGRDAEPDPAGRAGVLGTIAGILLASALGFLAWRRARSRGAPGGASPE